MLSLNFSLGATVQHASAKGMNALVHSSAFSVLGIKPVLTLFMSTVNHIPDSESLFALVSVEALRAGMEAGEATFPGALLRNSGLPYMDAGNSTQSS